MTASDLNRSPLRAGRRRQRGGIQLFSELVAAFVGRAAERPDVILRGSASPPLVGLAVRLQPQPWSAGAELLLWPGGARLSCWSPEGERTGPDTEVGLCFDGGFQWGCLLFPDADTLARALLQRLENELTERSESCSRGRPTHDGPPV